MTLYVVEYRETSKRALPVNKACVCSVPQSPASPMSSAVAGGLCNTELPGNPKWKLKCYPLGRVQLFANLWTVAHQILLSMGFSKNTGLGCHSLFQGIFPTQGLNSRLLRCRQILYSLSYQGSLIGKLVCPMPRLWRNLLEKMALKLFRRGLHWKIKTIKFYCISVLNVM